MGEPEQVKMRIPRIIIWLSGLMVLVACSNASISTGVDETTVVGGFQPSESVFNATVGVTPQYSPRVSETIPESPPVLGLETTPVPLPPSTSTQSGIIAYQVCSPFTIHPLEELPEIISSSYDPPPAGHEERHHGVDFSYYRRGERLSIQGTSVQSITSGRVAAAASEKFPYGNFVIVESTRSSLPSNLLERLNIATSESLYVLYAHLDKSPAVRIGESVDACQRLGEVGRSGNAGVPHLHLEMRIGPSGTFFSSMAYYNTSATVEEMDNYILWRTSGVFRHFNPLDLLISEQ